MPAAAYRALPVIVDAVQFSSSSSPGGIATLTAGAADVFLAADGTLTLTAEDQEDRTVRPGWWVSRTGDEVTIHSDAAFSLFFAPA